MTPRLTPDSSGMLAAMENSMHLSRRASSLRDKVIHASADIRIDSIEDAPENRPTSSSQNSTQNDPIVPCDAEKECERVKAAETQLWWDSAIAKYMGLNDGYESVAVLLIKWHDGLDELKTRDETEELYKLLTTHFHYTCHIVELDVLTKPQLQMNQHISTFLRHHDGSNKLMIVYYTGHGLYRTAEKYLELRASERLSPKSGDVRVEARLNWDRAEEQLHSEDVEGDVLTIMDTCYSSNLQKSGKEDTRTFELLSACAYDETTACPGPNSFTRALIDGLKDLLKDHGEKSFTTFHLQQKINSNPARRDTPSLLWHRLRHHDRHIRLAPMKPKESAENADLTSLSNLPRSYVTLRLALRKSELGQQGIEYLARRLSSAFSNPGLIGLQRVDWLGMKPARATHFGRAVLAMTYFKKWKRIMEKGKKSRKTVDKVVIPPPDLGGKLDTTSSKRKRGRENDNTLPSPKKGLLAVSHAANGQGTDGSPLSPPISDSSRADDIDRD